MRKLIISVLAVIGVLWPLTALAVTPVTRLEEPALAAIFEKANASGTFVLYDPRDNKLVFHDLERAERRFAPASTFKIVNALIALHYGVVQNADEIFYRWDGQSQSVKAWEKDMNLREGLRVSCVPAYQQLAQEIGLKRMDAALRELRYGNMQTGEVVDEFWLNGALQISAREQAVFWARLEMGQQAWGTENLDILREITMFERSGDKSLHAKTGTSVRLGQPLGWWVGWIRDHQSGRVWGFALNVDMPDYPDGPDRIALGLECLQTLEAW